MFGLNFDLNHPPEFMGVSPYIRGGSEIKPTAVIHLFILRTGGAVDTVNETLIFPLIPKVKIELDHLQSFQFHQVLF